MLKKLTSETDSKADHLATGMMNPDHPTFDGPLYEAVGRALTEWGNIESELSNLFGTCIDFRLGREGAMVSAGASSLIFFRIDGFSARMKMVDAALDYALSPSTWMKAAQKELSKRLYRRWSILSKSLNKLSQDRNRLAHWSVYVDSDSNGRHPRLSRSTRDPRFVRENQATKYDDSYAHDCITSFRKMWEDLASLCSDITQSELPIHRHLDNLRFVLQFWGADIDAVCAYLKEPVPQQQ